MKGSRPPDLGLGANVKFLPKAPVRVTLVLARGAWGSELDVKHGAGYARPVNSTHIGLLPTL